MAKRNPFRGENAAQALDDMFDPEDARVRVELPEWDQGGAEFDFDSAQRVNRQRTWDDGDADAVSGAGDWEGMGLAVPGLFKSKRDAALKASALRLLDEGYRRLFREAYNLSPSVPKANKLRRGFGSVGPAVLKAYKEYFSWYQSLIDIPDGDLPPKWASDLAGYRSQYDALRAQVSNVQAAKGKATAALPGGNLYDPPAQGESWSDWLTRFPTGSGIGFGAIVGIAALFYLWNRSR